MMGNQIVRATDKEEKIKLIARRSITAMAGIEQGEVLNLKNIGLQRTGNGLSPMFLDYIVGRYAVKKMKKGYRLRLEDFK